MDLYREHILDHYKHPRNFGKLKNATATAQAHNATCGDRIAIEINVKRITNYELRITDIRFSGVGCAISQASASMLTDKVKHMDVSQAMKLTVKDIIDMLGTTLTPSRTRCATLSLEVLHKAISSLK